MAFFTDLAQWFLFKKHPEENKMYQIRDLTPRQTEILAERNKLAQFINDRFTYILHGCSHPFVTIGRLQTSEASKIGLMGVVRTGEKSWLVDGFGTERPWIFKGRHSWIIHARRLMNSRQLKAVGSICLRTENTGNGAIETHAFCSVLFSPSYDVPVY